MSPVKLSQLVPRSISLSAQLLLTFAVLVAATVTGLTVVAYQNAETNLLDAARRDAQVAATTRDRLLTQLLRSRQRRADGFLERAESICGEPAARLGLGWSEDCVGAMLAEFQSTERARGAVLVYRDRTLASLGDGAVPAGGDAWSVEVSDARVDYVMTAVRGDARLMLRFDSSEVVPLFTDRTDLRGVGEAVLVSADGRPLTPLLLADASTAVRLEDEARRCAVPTDAQDTRVDYNGRSVIPAFRPTTPLRGVCIVVHLSESEARAPAAMLRRDLVTRGLVFIIIGVLMSLVAARYIAAPVRRLAGFARSLQLGRFNEPVPIAGPSEVRDLGQAFGLMAAEISTLVAREQAARREAESANRSKDQFLALLSHELRTPLTAILGWAHTLRTGQPDAERVHRGATVIERSADAQRRLIEDLMDVTGIAAGRVRIERRPTSLSGVVDAAVDAVGPRAGDKQVHLDTAVEPGLTVFGDPQRLQQIIWNLVWNGVKFTPPGGRVGVTVRASAGAAEITVTDTGVGIDPEFLPHVFGWFRRGDRKARSAEEGLGLGLALVRQLVELHEGTVRAQSAGRDAGSTFIVSLPLMQGGAAEDTPTAAASHRDRLASVRVLMVDDDAGSREAVRVLLEDAGAEVQTASSAAEARSLLRAGEADVLISDIAMAHESGYAFMQSLRAEGVRIPAIALTAYARREDADKARSAGFDVHLPKPVDPDALVNLLASFVTRVKSE